MAQVDPYEYCETQDAEPPPGEGWGLQEQLVIGKLTVFRWLRPTPDVRQRAREAWLKWDDEDREVELAAWRRVG
jgi:hypothetical protein